MLFFYNLGISLYTCLLFILSFFNGKAKLWTDGRRNLLTKIGQALTAHTGQRTIWFHFPSLGEFEQGRPVLEKVRETHPGRKIVVTFFSPSGYEIRKDHPLADHVFYLPSDTPAHARAFISLLNPEFAIFTKYDYWYHYFKTLQERQIPLYLISAIFHPKLSFFRWYGSLQRTMLGFITHIFVQDEASRTLLAGIGIQQVTISGDTRFDRVADIAAQVKSFPLIPGFTGDSPVFIAGSTWPADETLLAKLAETFPAWKFIIAPHEIGGNRIEEVSQTFKATGVVRYSELSASSHQTLTPGFSVGAPSAKTLIIDNIGMLSSLYQYGKVAYIGGGFGVGIHNTLEAAAFDLPVIFGPNYQRFREARDLVSEKAGFSINHAEQLREVLAFLSEPENGRAAGQRAGDYVRNHTGATAIIMRHILQRG